jgi:hypothetical protein
MRECVEEGILQSYYDGELSPNMMENVAAHLATCATCADAASEIENESLMLATAFAPELSLNVPTERLRERLDAAIAAERLQARAVVAESAGTRLRGWFAGFAASLNFTPQRAMAFASLIALVMFAALLTVMWNRSGVKGTRDASTGVAFVPSVNPNDRIRIATPPVSPTVIDAGGVDKQGDGNKFNKVGLRPRVRKPFAREAGTGNGKSIVEPAPLIPLPAERGYLEAISSLQTAIAESGVTALQPTLRADYERNLAVVDQAIDVTRRAARSHPTDTNTAQFLYSSYQSKIDMLRDVADQTQLVAVR